MANLSPHEGVRCRMATRRKFLKALASTGTPEVSRLLAVEPAIARYGLWSKTSIRKAGNNKLKRQGFAGSFTLVGFFGCSLFCWGVALCPP